MQKNFLVLIGFFLLFANSAFAKREYVDGTLLAVGGEPILRSDLADVKNAIEVGAVEKGLFYPSVGESDLDQTALNVLINESLIKQFCAEMKIEVPSSAVQDQLKAIIQSNPGISDLNDLEKALSREGSDLDGLKTRLHKQILFSKFNQQVIASQVSGVSEELKQEMLINQNDPSLDIFFIKKIMIECSGETDTCAAAKSKIEEARSLLDAGKSFEGVIKTHSADSDHDSEVLEYSLADLGSVEMKTALQKLEKGQSTAPIKLGEAYYLFNLVKKERKKDAASAAKLKEKLFRKKFIEWLKERRAKVFLPSNLNEIIVISKG